MVSICLQAAIYSPDTKFWVVNFSLPCNSALVVKFIPTSCASRRSRPLPYVQPVNVRAPGQDIPKGWGQPAAAKRIGEGV